MSDVLENCSYRQLKKQLVKSLQVNETAKLKHLLTELTLGDRAPSQLLREMKQLSGDKAGTVVQPFLLQRLSESTQAILACADSWCLDTLTVTTDEVHEVQVRSMVGEVYRDNSSEVAKLQQMMATLRAIVSKLVEAVGVLRLGRSTRSRSRSAP